MIDANDVNRYLASAVEDSVLAPYIAEAEEHIQNLTGRTWDGLDDEVSETFYNVREGSILWLNDIDPSEVASVEVFSKRTDSLLNAPEMLFLSWGSGTSITLTVDVQYQVLDRGRIQLFAAGIIPATWMRVVVTYTPSGSVPQVIKNAAAFLAATTYAQSTTATSGLKAETLGDYSYTKDTDAEGGDLLAAVRKRLIHYSRGRRARTT